jgi:hypothetical protein
MTEVRRITSLKTEHEHLASKIEVEEHRPAPDADLLHNLKREKLRVKDELADLDAL